MAKNTKIDLFRPEVSDEYSRENFNTLINFLRDQPLFKGKFEFMELSIGSAVTNAKYSHRLGFKPLDVIVTRLSNAGATFYINTDLSTSTQLDVTTNMAVTVRMFIGRYEETNV